MPFCPQCGTESQGRFCASCGAAIQNPTPGAAPGPTPGGSAGTSADLEENIASALCYLLLPLTGVLFLVLEPYNRNRNIRFHAYQAIFVFAGLFVVNLGLTMVAFMVPFIGWLFTILGSFVSLGGLLLWIGLMIKAYNKERWVLPVVGPMAEKQA